MEFLRDMPAGCEQMLATYRGKEQEGGSARLLRFPRVEDVYNITSPFDGVIAGRVEQRSTEFSKVMFFKEQGHAQDFAAPVLNLQDPFFSFHGQDVVLGGVSLLKQGQDGHTFKTEFFKGKDIYHLEHFASGPVGEKDIRLVQYDDAVGVMRRPQGGRHGPGRMIYQEIPSIEGLDAVLNLWREPTGHEVGGLQGNEWGGANQLFDLGNGRVGVLGHIARRDGIGNRHYYPMAFQLDRESGSFTTPLILAEASDFPAWKEAKRPDLDDVVFTGGLARNGNGTADLYVGMRDTYAAVKQIQDPF